MVTDKITKNDIKNFAKGILELTMPDYQSCRSAMSMVTYTKDCWKKEEGSEPPVFESSIDKEKNTITIRLVAPLQA